MIKSLKSLIIVGLASFALVACSQQSGGGNSKKSNPECKNGLESQWHRGLRRKRRHP